MNGGHVSSQTESLADIAVEPTDNRTGDGTRDALDRGLRNVRFEAADMTDFDEPDRYDFITSFDAVHDQKHPRQLIASI